MDDDHCSYFENANYYIFHKFVLSTITEIRIYFYNKRKTEALLIKCKCNQAQKILLVLEIIASVMPLGNTSFMI